MTAEASDFASRAWYGATTLLAAVLVGWFLAGPESDRTVYIVGIDVLAAALLVVAARSSRANRWARRGSLGLAFGLIVAGIAFGGWGVVASASIALVLLVGLAVPVMVARGILRRRRVDAQLVLGALTIYLVLGIFFAMAFSMLADLQTDQLFAISGITSDGTFRDHVYLSFITLSTTGYGDIVPITGASRAIAILTALTGQLYLVTAVATAVSLFAATRFPSVTTGGEERL